MNDRKMQPDWNQKASSRRPLFMLVLAFVAIVAICHCSMDPLTAGGNSSGTGNNGIVAAAGADTIAGTTIPGARVALYAQEYKPFLNPPGFCDSTVADDSGHFLFTGLTKGNFTLTAYDSGTGKYGLIAGIPLFPGMSHTDTLDSLRRPGFLQGTAIDSANRILPLAYVFIRGTPFYAVAGNRGEFLLGPLPAGGYRIGFFSNFALVNDSKNIVPQFISLLTEMQDTSVTMVFPDSVSRWGR